MAEKMQEEKIPKDAIFVVSIGEWDDYEVFTICRALYEIDPKELRRKYWEARREKGYSEASLEVLAWCEERGYLEKLPWRELNLGTEYALASVIQKEER